MEKNLVTEKSRLRLAIKDLLSALGAAAKAEKSRLIRGHIARTDEWRQAEIVLAFLPLPDEADLRPLIIEALSAGKAVGLPRIGGGEVVFRRVADMRDSFQAHPFGMLEPPADAPVMSAEDLAAARTLVLTPGLAFDRRGGRLGRGKGYYDRFFRSLEEAPAAESPAAGAGGASSRLWIRGPRAWGVVFALQIVDEVPMGEGDRRVEGLATEEGVI
jgi:5-formyltetrahydrofolate cyclo-ligase